MLFKLATWIIAYGYGGYRTFKHLEGRDPASNRTQEWILKYWILISLYSLAERLFDGVLKWLVPFYQEGKLLFVLWLSHPSMDGARYGATLYMQPLCVCLLLDSKLSNNCQTVKFTLQTQRGL